MFGIGRRMKAVHGQGPGEPRRTGDKLGLAQDQAALAIVVSAAAIILVAVVSLVLARNLENISRETTALLERQAEAQGAVRGLVEELSALKADLAAVRFQMARIETDEGERRRAEPTAESGAAQVGR